MDPRFWPAMAAAHAGDVGLFGRLLDADPTLAVARSACGHPTLLQFVVLEGGTGRIPDAAGFVQALLVRGAAVDEPLVAAASIGSVALADRLLRAGASVEACAPWTPLEEALYWGHQALAQTLRDRYGAAIRSLRAAAGLGALPIVQQLLGDGGVLAAAAGPVRYPWGTVSDEAADVRDQALVMACKNGQADAARLLLQAGARIDAFPPGIHEGGTALHLAALMGREAMVAVLLDAGADPRLVDPEHEATAAGWAAHGGHAVVAARLRQAEEGMPRGHERP